MAGITITARLRRNGTPAIPKKARETLGLHEGDQVEIIVNKPGTQAASPDGDPLLELIGIGKGGPADGAVDHAGRLYRHSSP